MGRRAADPANAFSVRVLHQLELARAEAGIAQRDMFERAGISANYYYKRLRGEAPLNTNDVHNLAAAIGYDAFFILEEAAKIEDGATVTSLDAHRVRGTEENDISEAAKRAAFEDDGDSGEDD